MAKNYPESIRIVEVSPRDGLQNVEAQVSAETKLTLIDKLSDAGVNDIEVASFVSPKWVPQMADAAEVVGQLKPHKETNYIVLTPNQKGFERALECGVKEVAVFTAASESFTQKNTNCSIDESLKRIETIMQSALDSGIRVRGYTSCVLGCPYDGEIAIAEVTRVTKALIDMGCYEVSLGDTIGIGGCPYAKGASGNVSTEDVVYMLQGMGIQTGIDLKKLALAGRYITDQLGCTNSSRVGTLLSSKLCN